MHIMWTEMLLPLNSLRSQSPVPEWWASSQKQTGGERYQLARAVRCIRRGLLVRHTHNGITNNTTCLSRAFTPAVRVLCVDVPAPNGRVSGFTCTAGSGVSHGQGQTWHRFVDLC